jgi:hypothetical protein
VGNCGSRFQNEEVKGVIEKTVKRGIIGKISSHGYSVTDDLQDHFGVLNELAARLEEYYAMSTIPAEHGWE